MTFKEALQAVRKRERYTQEQAAAQIPKLSLEMFQEWEAGREEPPQWAQELILEALGGAPYGFR